MPQSGSYDSSLIWLRTQTMIYNELPSGWTKNKYDVHRDGDGDDLQVEEVEWVSNDGDHIVTLTQDLTSRIQSNLLIECSQYVSDGEYEAHVRTHTALATSLPEAENLVVEYMNDVLAGRRCVACLGTERWKEFVQFYVIQDESVPGPLTASQLINAADESDFSSGVDEEYVSDDTSRRDAHEESLQQADSVIEVDVHPRHIDEVSVVDDSA